MSENVSPILSFLRLVAFLGTAMVLLWHVVSMPELQPRQSAGFIILGLALLAVGLMLLILSDATKRILQYTDLLVPLGLFVTVSTVVNTVAEVPAVATVLAVPWTVKILTLTLALSIELIITSLLTVVYIGWTTVLIFQVVVEGQINLMAPLAVIGQWFWRTLILGLLGWGILLAVSALAFIPATASITVALVLLAIISLAWNLLTAAVLPVVLADCRPFWASVKDGLRISWTGMRKWAPLVIAQMVLLGWITVIHVSYTTRSTDDDGSIQRVTTTSKNGTDWNVNGFWTGGYADECKWHEKLMQSLDSKPLALVDRLLTLLFAVLAIAIKIKIVSGLYEPSPNYEAASPERQSDFISVV